MIDTPTLLNTIERMETGIIVAVSIGNTTTSAGIFLDGSLIRTTRVPTHSLHDIWRLFGHVADDFRGSTTAIVIGSVVPSVTQTAAEIAHGEFDAPVRFYRKNVPTGLSVKTKAPDKIGDDRLTHALAAFTRTEAAVIVTDFGTAITIDAVTDNREFIGGAIMPSARVSADSLARRTALLPRVDLKGEVICPGRDTESAIRLGIVNGIAGAVDRIIEQMWDALSTEAMVIGTGGEAGLIAPHTKHVKEIEPALTLEGLVRAVECENSPETQTEGAE